MPYIFVLIYDWDLGIFLNSLNNKNHKETDFFKLWFGHFHILNTGWCFAMQSLKWSYCNSCNFHVTLNQHSSQIRMTGLNPQISLTSSSFVSWLIYIGTVRCKYYGDSSIQTKLKRKLWKLVLIPHLYPPYCLCTNFQASLCTCRSVLAMWSVHTRIWYRPHF